MARKQMFEGGTKNRIIEVGSHLFFEKGFDGTSIREIMKEVGADVGSFYYYYKTKDDLFTDVLECFFAPYKQDLEKIVDESEQRPYRAIFRFFEYIKTQTKLFREKYADNMHRTVRWAIREQTLTVIEPYLERIICILIKYGANPVMNPHLTAIFLAHGVGSIILHEDSDFVEVYTDQMRQTVNMIMGLDKQIAAKMFDNEISEEDFNELMNDKERKNIGVD